MPFYVRKLPCMNGKLIEEKQIPPNTDLYNPSRTGKYTYIRQTVHTQNGDVNSMVMHDSVSQKITHIESPSDLPKTVNLFKGIEDLRICEYKGRIWFGGTSTHVSKRMNNELVIGYFNKDVTSVEKWRAVDIGCLPVKNVIPFVSGEWLLFLDVYLGKVYKLEDDWSLSVYRKLRFGKGFDPDMVLRGSTPPIHLHGDTWGCVVHDIIFNDNKKLVNRLSYMHLWLEFNLELGLITFVSTPFWLVHWGVEYVSGIERLEDGRVGLYVGVQDHIPVKCVTSLSDLRIGK